MNPPMSPAAAVSLGRRRGYRLVGANRFGFNLFFRIKNSIRPESVPNFMEELHAYRASIGAGVAAWRQRETAEEHSE